MPKLSPAREGVPLLQGLKLVSRGKVRDTYELPGFPHLLLAVVTDGISIFDFVLNALVPIKGAVLNALNHFWLLKLEEQGIATHFVAAGSEIDQYLPEQLRGNADLQSRAMVIRRLEMVDVEFVYRGYLTGSGWKSYQQDGTVCGITLPPGLHDGSRLDEPIFTPTSKAETGHDLPLNAEEVRQQYPEEVELGFRVYRFIREFAERRGCIFADTKFEIGHDPNGVIVLGDEVGTPDSSRFWLLMQWLMLEASSKPKSPSPYDKQVTRNWGIEQELNPDAKKYDPENDEDVARVHALVVPDEVVKLTTQTYRYIFWLITGKTIERYLIDELGVNATPLQPRNIAIVLGSESDVAVLREAFPEKPVDPMIASLCVHVLSSHRHSVELAKFVDGGCRGADVLIAAGSKALVLPGDLAIKIRTSGQSVPVIGVALGQEGSEPLLAAQLSIRQIPEEPVIMDDVHGQPYTGIPGLYHALLQASSGEFPPARPSSQKLYQYDVKVWE